MNIALAHSKLVEVLALIDTWAALYERRWGKKPPYDKNHNLAAEVDELVDQVRARTRLAQDVILAMGQPNLAAEVSEQKGGQFSGHPFKQARVAIIEAIAILAQQEELAEIVGPTGPRLSASALHPTVWDAAARLWDDGHRRAAVQTAATALEGALQSITGPSVSGENLATLFSVSDPAQGITASQVSRR